MAILHKNITASGDIHNPKWHPDANNGDYAWKNEKGELESIDELLLPAALNFVDGSVAPPTSNTNDIYILSSGGSVNAGWGSVALQDWVKYDGAAWNAITPQKSSLCYDKNADSLMSFDGAAWAAIGGAGGAGVFGITNSLGEYTYYTTFQLALAAATSGDTVEQFADVSVSTASSITLDKDITWNMNGYEYKNTSTSSFIMLDVSSATTVNITINNGKITRNTGSSNGGVLFDTGTKLDSIIKINGVTFENVEGGLLSGSATIIGGVYRSSGTTTFFYSGKVYTIKMFANVAGTFNGVNARVYNSIFEISAGYAYLNNGAEAYNSYFKGSTYGLRLGVGANKAYNCTCEATAFHGIFVTSGELHNCNGFSALYYGIQLGGTAARAYNCTAKSGAQIAMWLISGQAFNCFVESSANYGVHVQTANSVFKGGSVISKLNSSTGRGFYIAADNFDITNNTIEVVNSGAPCITGTAGRTGKFAGNIFKGSTTAVTVVTNSITNTQDSQGNILI